MKKIIFISVWIMMLSQTLFAIEHINSIDEYKRLTSRGNVLVDFYAPWCPPCKVLGYNLEKLEKRGLDIKIYKINIEENPNLQVMFGKEQIPYVIYMKDGQVVNSELGSKSVDELENIVNSIF